MNVFQYLWLQINVLFFIINSSFSQHLTFVYLGVWNIKTNIHICNFSRQKMVWSHCKENVCVMSFLQSGNGDSSSNTMYLLSRQGMLMFDICKNQNWNDTWFLYLWVTSPVVIAASNFLPTLFIVACFQKSRYLFIIIVHLGDTLC